MTNLVTRTAVKAIFETGDPLSEASFISLIDTVATKEEVDAKAPSIIPGVAVPAFAVDITNLINTKTVSANHTFTLAGTPVAGTRTKLRLTGDTTLERRVTVPSYFDYASGQARTTVDVPAASVVNLDLEYTGSAWQGQSSNRFIKYYPNQSTLAMGFNVGGVTTDGTGAGNIAIGVDCFISNISSTDCGFFGFEAGKLQQRGVGNMGFGRLSMSKNVHGTNCTAFGDSTLKENVGLYDGTQGSGNGAFGYTCLQNLTTAIDCNVFGKGGFWSTTTGSYNNGVGDGVGYYNITGTRNNYFGRQAGYICTGNDNSAFGHNSMSNYTQFAVGNQLGENASFGHSSGGALVTGGRNTFIGGAAGASGLQKVDAYISMALGWNSYTTKDYQIVLGSSDVTETVLRGNPIFSGITNSNVPATNGEFTIEATNATTITLRYKLAGVVKSLALTLT